jgi:ubiquinone/menaquinone biosynthesis C-methylase UbiE
LNDQADHKDRIYFIGKQEISLKCLEIDQLILDLGGGGEGIIGRLMGEKVIAIDPSIRELQEAPPGPLKIVMDARDLQFLDASFSIVTAFFTLMYINEVDHRKVFKEVLRVLEPGGEFWIWDGQLPTCLDTTKDNIAFHLIIILPNEVIETGYGTKWPKVEIDAGYYLHLAEEVGFTLVNSESSEITFKLQFRKPLV